MKLPEGYQLEQPATQPGIPAGYQIEQAPGEIESFGRAAVNNLPFGGQLGALGTQALSDEPQDYSQALAEWKSKAEIAKKENPLSYGAGAVTGAVAPAFIPGVGAATKAAPFLTNAALGAGYALGDTDLAKTSAADIAKQGTTGALVGGGVGKATAGLGYLGSKMGNTQLGHRVKTEVLADFLHLNPGSLKRLAPGVENPESAIMEVGNKLDELFPNDFGLNDTGSTVYQKILNKHEAAQNTLGNTVERVSKAGLEMPEVDDAIVQLRKVAKQRFGKLTTAENVEAKAFLNDQATTLEELKKTGNLDFRQLADLKTAIGEEFHNLETANKGAGPAYAIVSEKIDKILQRASDTIDPALKPAYDQARKTFAFTSNLLPAMKRGINREVIHQRGKLANMGLFGAAMMGHPLAAAVGFAGKQAIKAAAPDFGTNLAYRTITQGVPPSAQQGINQALTDYLTEMYGPKQ